MAPVGACIMYYTRRNALTALPIYIFILFTNYLVIVDWLVSFFFIICAKCKLNYK